MSSSSYRAIIGLAGHVDHGKTTLIKALTGITTARPHEQLLGMTQDLGFAHFADQDGNLIGVIDVPGHERYIRNMVAGIWSLDLVLLVIAADEGWMPMTTEHLKVVTAMGIERLLICITNSDRVSAEALAQQEEKALEQVMEMSGLVPGIITVSAASGHNMDALKQIIVSQLRPLSERNRAHEAPRLYVDRVFTSQGTGTVITGSLCRGSLKIGDRLRLYPSGREVQVRSLQSYHQELEEVSAVSRVAVGLKKVPHKEVARGDCLATSQSGCLIANQLIVRLHSELTESQRPREVEVALGTWQGRVQFIPIRYTRLARLQSREPIPCFFGQHVAIIRHGSSELLHAAQLLWSGDVPPSKRKTLHQLLMALPEQLEQYNPAQMQLALDGYAPHHLFTMLPDSTERQGDWLVTRDWLQASRSAILDLLAPVGSAYSLSELAYKLFADERVLQPILATLKAEQLIRLHHDKWQRGSGDSEDELEPQARQLLADIRGLGKTGYEPGKLPSNSPIIKQLRNLARLKYLIQLEGPIYYDSELYQQLVYQVLVNRKIGDLISMPEFKEITGLSRKYSIPFCLRMEMDGWVRRQENDRLVLRLPDAP